MNIELPDDILYLICAELQAREDFATLYSCSQVARNLAPIALTSLYRLYSKAHHDDDDDDQGLTSPAQQRLAVQRWAVTWRSILLSCHPDATLFPYVTYLRQLDLRDFQCLIEDSRFPGAIANRMFAGPLAQYHHRITRTSLRGGKFQVLDVRAIVEAVGNLIVQHVPLIEVLSGDFSGPALLSWLPRLQQLRRLELGRNGAILGMPDVRDALTKNCPRLEALTIYLWEDFSADGAFATVIQGLTPNALKILETHSRCNIGPALCGALSAYHASSLTRLKLEVEPSAVPALEELTKHGGWPALTALRLELSAPVPNLDELQPDLVTAIAQWLPKCASIHTIELAGFRTAPALLTPLLLTPAGPLRELAVTGKLASWYSMASPAARDFHLALASQPQLHALSLAANPEGAMFNDILALSSSLSRLRALRRLFLHGISEPLPEMAFVSAFQALPFLKDVVLYRDPHTDSILTALKSCRCLESVQLLGSCRLSAAALEDFVANLGPSNAGLELAVDNAILPLDDAVVRTIADKLREKVGGRFEYVPMGEFDVSDPELGSDSD